MKLRVKVQGRSQVINLEQREPSAITLDELKSAISSHFGFENNDFQVSLNKVDSLSPDEQTLSEFGIVSGDLLYVIGASVNLPQVEQNNEQPSQDIPPDLEVHVNRFLLEPLVVRESSATQVPALLEQLYLSTTCDSAVEAVWVVVHTLMLEAGFTPFQQDSDVAQIPADWKQSGFYKCVYHLPFPDKEPGKCSVVGVPLASSLILHGLTSSDEPYKTEQLQLKSSDYVAKLSNNVPEVYIGLDRLSRRFKDSICLPLQNELAADAGFLEGQGFISLPYEIKIRILSSVDATTLCHVAQTGRNLCSLARDKAIWRRLYFRDFGQPENSAFSRNWYELYKEKYQQRKEERQRRLLSLEDIGALFGIPGGPRQYPHPGMRFPPHLIGGDYDAYPYFGTGNISNPLNPNRGRPPGLVPPIGRIADPFCDNLLAQGMPSRPGGRDMTGSPFSGGGRRTMFRNSFM